MIEVWTENVTATRTGRKDCGSRKERAPRKDGREFLVKREEREGGGAEGVRSRRREKPVQRFRSPLTPGIRGAGWTGWTGPHTVYKADYSVRDSAAVLPTASVECNNAVALGG
jgi:hypothetical protein